MDEDTSAVERQSIYVRASAWMQLRQRGLDSGTSASAQVAALIDYYLDGMSNAQQARIVERAREITKGSRGRG